MVCEHKNLRLSHVSIKHNEGSPALIVGDLVCKCGTKFVFDGEPRTANGGGRAVLPIRPVGYDPRRLFCDCCGKRVFGGQLDRATIVGLDCRGVVHRVEFSDGVVHEYTPGVPFKVIDDEQEAKTPGEGTEER